MDVKNFHHSFEKVNSKGKRQHQSCREGLWSRRSAEKEEEGSKNIRSCVESKHSFTGGKHCFCSSCSRTTSKSKLRVCCIETSPAFRLKGEKCKGDLQEDCANQKGRAGHLLISFSVKADEGSFPARQNSKLYLESTQIKIITFVYSEFFDLVFSMYAFIQQQKRISKYVCMLL